MPSWALELLVAAVGMSEGLEAPVDLVLQFSHPFYELLLLLQVFGPGVDQGILVQSVVP